MTAFLFSIMRHLYVFMFDFRSCLMCLVYSNYITCKVAQLWIYWIYSSRQFLLQILKPELFRPFFWGGIPLLNHHHGGVTFHPPSFTVTTNVPCKWIHRICTCFQGTFPLWTSCTPKRPGFHGSTACMQDATGGSTHSENHQKIRKKTIRFPPETTRNAIVTPFSAKVAESRPSIWAVYLVLSSGALRKLRENVNAQRVYKRPRLSYVKDWIILVSIPGNSLIFPTTSRHDFEC